MITQGMVEKAAAAIANARGGRRGAPPITNLLEILAEADPEVHAQVLDDARVALESVDGQVVYAPYWLWFGLLARQAYALGPNGDGCEGDAEGTDESTDCSQTSACLTEWCQACAARQFLRDMARRGDESAIGVLQSIDDDTFLESLREAAKAAEKAVT